MGTQSTAFQTGAGILWLDTMAMLCRHWNARNGVNILMLTNYMVIGGGGGRAVEGRWAIIFYLFIFGGEL